MTPVDAHASARYSRSSRRARRTGRSPSELCIAHGTVRRHLENAYAKLGVHTRTAAVRAADALGSVLGAALGAVLTAVTRRAGGLDLPKI